MERRSFRTTMLISALFVVTFVLAACPANSGQAPSAGQPDGQATEADAGEAATSAAPQGATELQLMGWSSSEAENERLNSVVDTFNSQHPDRHTTVNLVPSYDERIQTSLAGGSPPDVFYIDSVRLPDFVAAGALEPYEPYAVNPDDFYPSLRSAFTISDTFYCPPKDFSTLALVYNKQMFADANLPVPTADWAWDDLRNAAQALTNQDTGVYGLSLSPDFARLIAFIYQAGGSVTNEDFTQMTINSPEAQEAINFYVNLVLDGYAAVPANLDSGWPGEAFGKGRAAMVVEGNWIVPFLADQFPDIQYAVSELPSGPGGQATMAFTVCYGVPSNGTHTEAAFELVNYLTGSEGMKMWTDLGLAMPTRQSLAEGWLAQFPDLQPFLAGADYAHPWQFRPGFQDVLDSINAGLEQAMNGSKQPAAVLADAEEVGNEVLNR